MGVLSVSSKEGRDALVALNSLGFLQTVGANARLQQLTYAHIKAASGRTSVGEHLVVKGTPQVSVGVKLDHGQGRKVAVNGGMMASGVHDGRQDAVLASQKQGEQIAVVERSSVRRQLVQLCSQRRGCSLPNGLCRDDKTSREVVAQSVVVQLDLGAGLNAGLRPIDSTGAVRGGQLVSEGNHGNIGRTIATREAEKRPFLKVLRHDLSRPSPPSSSCR